MKRPRLLIAATASAAALALAVPPATASPPQLEPSDPIVSGLAGPLQLDVGHNGQIYVGQSFSGALTKVRPDGTTKDLVTEVGSVTGVASRGYHVAYTFSGGDETRPVMLLKKRSSNGTVRTIANLSRFERKHNPDARQVYGFRGLSDECLAQLPPEEVAPGLAPYTGIIESNPYAVANAPDGGWYVADAAANDILKVSPSGRIKVVEVFRPLVTRVSAEAAAALGLPECTAGKKFAFEPVPTDVEVARSGHLVVSLLPGGPEDDSLGARGRVLLVNPGHDHDNDRYGDDDDHGDGKVLARGLLGATNVAIGYDGKVFVTELFGNRVSVIHHGHVRPVAELPSPAGIEFAKGTLYVSVDVFANGSIVTLGR